MHVYIHCQTLIEMYNVDIGDKILPLLMKLYLYIVEMAEGTKRCVIMLTNLYCKVRTVQI